MTGIIEEIQRGAIDDKKSVDGLLRQVKLAAAKLRLPALEGWVESELNGYTSGELPDYRVLHGQLRAWNPYNGWIPVHFGDTQTADALTTANVRQSCASLVDLASRKGEDDQGVHFPLPPGLVNIVNEMTDFQSPRYIIQLSRGHIISILDRVRNLVLDWAIRMEQEGVLGEGISFSEAERVQAQHAMTTVNIGNIGNMAGHIGAGNEGAVRATQTANEASIFDQLAEAISAGVTSGAEREHLLAAVERMAAVKDNKSALAAVYSDFISAAAAHMTIVAPFLPALGSLFA